LPAKAEALEGGDDLDARRLALDEVEDRLERRLGVRQPGAGDVGVRVFADVTQDFWALVVSPFSFDTGIQKIEREPFSRRRAWSGACPPRCP
jgi:hypothetical protein